MPSDQAPTPEGLQRRLVRGGWISGQDGRGKDETDQDNAAAHGTKG